MGAALPLVGALRERIEAVGASGDRSSVFGSGALADSCRLVSMIDTEGFVATAGPQVAHDAVTVLADFFWTRFLGGDQNSSVEYMSAIPFFIIRRDLDPYAVIPIELASSHGELQDAVGFGSIRDTWDELASETIERVIGNDKRVRVDDAILLLDRLLATEGLSAPALSRAFFNLAIALDVRGQRNRSTNDLDCALLALQQSTAGLAETDPLYASRMAARGTFARHYHTLDGRQLHLREAVDTYNEVLMRLPANNIDKIMHTINFVEIAQILYVQTGETDAIDRALVLLLRIQKAQRRANMPTLQFDTRLKDLLITRFVPAANSAQRGRRVLLAIAPRGWYINVTLGQAERFERQYLGYGDPADFSRSIAAYAGLLTVRGSDDEHAIIFRCTGQLIVHRYRNQQLEHLAEAAVLLLELAFEGRRPGTYGELINVFEIAEALSWRFDVTGDMRDLDDAIANLRQLSGTAFDAKASRRLAELLIQRSARAPRAHGLASMEVTASVTAENDFRQPRDVPLRATLQDGTATPTDDEPLGAAIIGYRRALAKLSADDPLRLTYTVDLANCLGRAAHAGLDVAPADEGVLLLARLSADLRAKGTVPESITRQLVALIGARFGVDVELPASTTGIAAERPEEGSSTAATEEPPPRSMPATAEEAEIWEVIAKCQRPNDLAVLRSRRAVRAVKRAALALQANSRAGSDLATDPLTAALAKLCWYRFLVLPVGMDAHDFGLAVRMYRLALKADPKALRPLLREIVAGAADPAESDLVAQARAVEAHLQLAPDPLLCGKLLAATQAALSARTWGPADRVTLLGLLGIAHDRIYHMSLDFSQVRASAAAFRSALDETREHPNRAKFLESFGGVLLHLEEAGDPSALDKAVELYAEAVTLPDTLDSPLSERWDALVRVVAGLIVTAPDDARARAAIEKVRAAVGLTDPDDPIRQYRLVRLCEVYALLARLADTPESIEAFASVARECVDSVTGDSAEDLRASGLLGLALYLRWKRLDDSADLDESIRALRRATMGPTATERLGYLGIALVRRFDRHGDRADLEQAIVVVARMLLTTHEATRRLALILLGWLYQQLSSRHDGTSVPLETSLAFLDGAVAGTHGEIDAMALPDTNAEPYAMLRQEQAASLEGRNEAVETPSGGDASDPDAQSGPGIESLLAQALAGELDLDEAEGLVLALGDRAAKRIVDLGPLRTNKLALPVRPQNGPHATVAAAEIPGTVEAFAQQVLSRAMPVAVAERTFPVFAIDAAAAEVADRLAQETDELMRGHQWSQALVRSRLLLAGLRTTAHDDVTARARAMASLVLVDTAREMLSEAADPDLFTMAKAAGEWALALGEVLQDTALTGTASFRLGTLHLQSASRALADRRWDTRNGAEAADPTAYRPWALSVNGTIHQPRRMPPPSSMLKTAASYFRRAIPLGEGEHRGEVYYRLAAALNNLRLARGVIDDKELDDAVTQALDLLPDDSPRRAALAAVATGTRAAAEAARQAGALEADIDGYVRRHGATDTVRAAVYVANALAEDEPQRAVNLLDIAEKLARPLDDDIPLGQVLSAKVDVVPLALAPGWRSPPPGPATVLDEVTRPDSCGPLEAIGRLLACAQRRLRHHRVGDDPAHRRTHPGKRRRRRGVKRDNFLSARQDPDERPGRAARHHRAGEGGSTLLGGGLGATRHRLPGSAAAHDRRLVSGGLRHSDRPRRHRHELAASRRKPGPGTAGGPRTPARLSAYRRR